MRLSGRTWIPNGDEYFGPIFEGVDVFEGKNLETGLRYVTEWDCAIDGGAHVGSWTRALAGKFRRVYAFEPQPDNFACLLENVKAIENVRCYRAALGEGSRQIHLQPGNNSGCWHIADTGVSSCMMVLDEFRKLDRVRVGYIKLDVEGYEYFALLGARKLLERCKPVVQIEEKKLSHSYEGPPARSLLEGMGYKEVAKSGRDVVFVWA